MKDDASRHSPSRTSRPPRAADELDRFAATEYETLRELTHRLRRRGLAGGDAPGTDSLVHEAYLRLRNSGKATWHDRTHFLAVAALQLRHLLVDHARRTRAQKREGDHVRVSLDAEEIPAKESVMDVLVLDEALKRLARQEARQHRVAELRLFGALSVEEVAAVLEVSERTVKEDWRQARTWLARELRRDHTAPWTARGSGHEQPERGHGLARPLRGRDADLKEDM